MNRKKEDFDIKEYYDALDMIFNDNLTDAVIRFESDGCVLCLEIINGNAEIIIYN